jgi:hypothetical protein
VTGVGFEDVNQLATLRLGGEQDLAAFHRFVLNTLAHLHSIAPLPTRM